MRIGLFLGDCFSLMYWLTLCGKVKYKLGLLLTLGPDSSVTKSECFYRSSRTLQACNEYTPSIFLGFVIVSGSRLELAVCSLCM